MKKQRKISSTLSGNVLPCLMMIFHFVSLALFTINVQANESQSSSFSSVQHHQQKQVFSPIIEITEEELNETEDENQEDLKKRSLLFFKTYQETFLVIDQFFQIQKVAYQSFHIWPLTAIHGKDQLIFFHQFKIDL